MKLACVNQDAGVKPGSHKGAAVHVDAMRRAFAQLGATVVAVDDKQDADVASHLAGAHAAGALDAVYERYALGAETASRFAAAHGVAHVLEVNAPLMEEARIHRGFSPTPADEAREQRIFAGAARVLCVSSEVADHVARRGVPRDRIWVRPNGVDTSRFVPRPRPTGPAGPFILGFHGRLRPWHGFEGLVTVLRTLLERGLDARLEIVGEGDFAAHMEGRVPDSAWRHVEWLPHERMPGFVARFDALVLTYPVDAPCYFSPLKLLEAMAVGAVPVVPALGDLDRVVTDGRSGLVYTAGRLDQAAGAVSSLITDRELRVRLLEGAVDVARRHSWRALAEEIVAALPSLVEAR